MTRTSSLKVLLQAIQLVSANPATAGATGATPPSALAVVAGPVTGALRGAIVGEAVGRVVEDAFDDPDAVAFFGSLGAILGFVEALAEVDARARARSVPRIG